ncbi:MAG: hypothetical protein EZS28_030259, partial [Streblomastix strix]
FLQSQQHVSPLRYASSQSSLNSSQLSDTKQSYENEDWSTSKEEQQIIDKYNKKGKKQKLIKKKKKKAQLSSIEDKKDKIENEKEKEKKKVEKKEQQNEEEKKKDEVEQIKEEDQEETGDENEQSEEDEIQEIKEQEPEYEYVKGKVLITLHRLSDLPANDINGKSDPYVIFKLGQEEYKSKTINNELNPEYNESLQLSYDPNSTDEKELKIEVWDYDRFSDNDILGSTSVKFGKYLDNQQDIELDLIGNDKQNIATNAGKAYLSILYQRLYEIQKINEQDLEESGDEVQQTQESQQPGEDEVQTINEQDLEESGDEVQQTQESQQPGEDEVQKINEQDLEESGDEHVINQKNKQFSKIAHGDEDKKKKKKGGLSVGPVLVVFLIIVVVGSSLIEFSNTLFSKGRS